MAMAIVQGKNDRERGKRCWLPEREEDRNNKRWCSPEGIFAEASTPRLMCCSDKPSRRGQHKGGGKRVFAGSTIDAKIDVLQQQTVKKRVAQRGETVYSPALQGQACEEIYSPRRVEWRGYNDTEKP